MNLTINALTSRESSNLSHSSNQPAAAVSSFQKLWPPIHLLTFANLATLNLKIQILKSEVSRQYFHKIVLVLRKFVQKSQLQPSGCRMKNCTIHRSSIPMSLTFLEKIVAKLTLLTIQQFNMGVSRRKCVFKLICINLPTFEHPKTSYGLENSKTTGVFAHTFWRSMSQLLYLF